MAYDENACLSVLEKKHVMSVLLFLLKEGGKSYKNDVYKATSTNWDMRQKLDDMVECDLITMAKDTKAGRVGVALTEKGTTIANMLVDIHKVMSNNQ